MIKVVFLDVGGTLIRPFPSVGGVYARVAAEHGVNVPAEELDRRFADAWNRQKKSAKKIEKDWWRSIVGETFAGITFKDPHLFFESIYGSFRNIDNWKIFPDVIETLDELKRRGMRMAVASNWDERLPDLLDDLKLAPYFEKQFISFSLGFQKPDPRFFRIALKQMNIEPLEALHVGDSADEDIAAAEAAGIRAYLLDRTQKPLSSRTMSHLGEILARL